MSPTFHLPPCSRRALRYAALLCLGLIATAAQAQNNTGAQIGTGQDVIRRAPDGTIEQRIPFRLTDPELGEIDLVSRAPKPKTFTFSTDQNLLYTTNAFLVPDREQASFFWNGRLLASVVPYSTVNFTPRITYEQNFFRYDKFSQLDFDSNSLQFDMKYDFNRNDTWFANLSYTGTRFYSPEDNVGEFYRFGVLNGSVTHVRQLGELPLRAVGTLGANWRHGDPSSFDRATTYLHLLLVYSPFDTLQILAFARPELQFYLHDPDRSSRTDVNLSTGASVIWTPIEYLSFGLTAALTGNYSSSDRNDYEVFTPSAVASGRFSF